MSSQSGTPWDRTVLALLALSAAASACFVASDSDLGFHLATGREILQSGRIPALNVLSYTEPTHPWQLHQWLPATLFELVFQRLDIAGVIGAKMALVAVTWTVVYQSARRLGAAPLPAGVACLGAVAASAFRFEARPHLFTHLTLALVLLLSTSLVGRREPPQPSARRRTVLAIALVLALGLQLHASIDGLLALLALAGGCIVQPLHVRWLGAEPQPASGARGAAPLLLAAGLGLALGAGALQLYHPIGASMLGFAFEVGSDPYLAEHLIEVRPLHRFPLELLPLTWAWLAVVLATAASRRKVLHAGQLALLVLFTLLALRFVRMAYAVAIVSAPLVALALCRAPLGLGRLQHHLRQQLRPALRAALLVACAVAAPLYVYRDHTPGFGYAPSIWPHGHFGFVRTQRVVGRAFVSTAWAGSFLGVFYPEQKSFFDLRLEAYSKGMLRDVYQRILDGRPGWDALLDRYGVEWLLLRYTSPGEGARQGGAPNLRQHLARDPRFVLVRFDDDGMLFVRKAGRDAALAERFGMPCVDPDRRSFTRQPDAACVRAMQDAIRGGNHARHLLLTTAIALAATAPSPLALGLAEQALRAGASDPWAERALAFTRCRAERKGGCTAP